MKVAVLSPPGEGQLGVSFASALRRDGHDAEVIQALPLTGGSRALIAARRARVDGALSAALCRPIERRLEEARPDLTIVVKGRFLSGRDVRRLRGASGAAVVNYYPDNPFSTEFGERRVVEAIPAYDHVFIWSPELVGELEKAGVRHASYLPFGYDDELYGPPAREEPPTWDVGFVGQWYETRERHVRALEGLRVVVAGPGWRSRFETRPQEGCTVLDGNPHGRSAAEVYHRCRLGLNILHPDNAHSHNMRTWEAPATRTACVMTASGFHRRLFGDKGIGAVEGPHDIRGVVDGLLEDDAARAEVAAAGRAAVEDGTYRARMRELLASLARPGGAEREEVPEPSK